MPISPRPPKCASEFIGLGVLGADAARKLAMIGFDVAGWSGTPRDLDGIACFHGVDGPRSPCSPARDILVALLPLTPQTRGMLNARLFGKLARRRPPWRPDPASTPGGAACRSRRTFWRRSTRGVLKAATLDVFEVEPLPEESPLWRHPRVTISPHNAAISTPGAVLRYIARQIEAFERGEPLQNVIDRGRRY